MSKSHHFRFQKIVGTALLTMSPMWCGAQIYKCVENGSPTFQSEPCKTGGTLVHLDAGPTAQEIEAARARTENGKKASEQIDSDWKLRKKSADAIKPVDCGKLNKSVADAEAQRNQLMMGVGNPGATDAGIRNVNRLSGPIDQQYNYAKNMAGASGCQ
jgi:hypothetical protein